ncbi:NAD(P)H-hydrate dehydratase [Caulobacter sp. 17J65-9]|uniref:NAD(P)H-hydrate dehydratase n=1 Tax=Caulobacter sp. 17J65-9 TaxID=2709382 RepID=UPI0013C7FBE8|nr:NAD(P)H-hydrate dehydratase [Caulobacter sp. 17J65-9]NEX94383.1 NAD(P)H-hydrate dehydratase [Caulobacter sp. 17J65-9]
MRRGREILTVAEAAAADRGAVEQGVERFALMRAAGRAVARELIARWTARPVAVLCGPGDNGGDGYVAAHILAEAGWPVRVAALAEPTTPDAARARTLWIGPVETLEPKVVAEAGVVVDALFGAGLSRPLAHPVAEVLKAAEAAGAPIVAVDLPSGLAGDTGEALGYAPRAALTVTFHRKKPAHVLVKGRVLCGEVVVADIGVPEAATPSTQLCENGPDLWLARFPWPEPEAHKHARGRLGVISGAMFETGAARLAARAGLRTGAGVVRIFCAPEAAPILAAHVEAVMLNVFETDMELEQAAQPLDAAVIGPAAGVTEETAANLAALARTGAALVIDADALTVFRGDPGELFAQLDRDDVLTPHPGEFERVFPGLLAGSPERITAARKAAERAGAIVVLKGPDTVVAAPDGRACVNTVEAPWLATAGSGDVLAGVIGALLAQNMDSFDAASAAVWMHAEAARGFGPGLTAEDLPDLLPGVLDALWRGAR